jgi:hypothetical protein
MPAINFKINMTKEHVFLIADDGDHEKVFIEIYPKGKFVALISQERGIDDMDIEFPGPGLLESLIKRKMPLKEFLDLITQAAKVL